jgi:putative FmdB family regulatory protein
MPIYEYRCKQCEISKQISRSFSDKDPGYKCDTCNSDLIRVYSNVGVAFKGSGFYSTDK